MDMKKCGRCDVEKPMTADNFVRNRPAYSRGRELPRTYHDTCKVCESAAKKLSWVGRHERKLAAADGPNDMLMKLIAEKKARENVSGLPDKTP